MQADFLKNLVALLAQAGGNVTLALPDLRAIGLELTLTNISSDTQGSITLRLGAKIYYVPAAGVDTTRPEKEQQWQEQAKISNGSSEAATVASESSRQQQALSNRVTEEIRAINRINNRPIAPTTPIHTTHPTLRTKKIVSASEELPLSPVGVYHTTDLSSFLREREVADARERYQHNQQRRNQPGVEEGILPFHTRKGSPTPQSLEDLSKGKR